MNNNAETTPETRLAFFTGALRELNELAETLEEFHDETGLEVPGPLAHYLGGRRKQLAANIARLKTEIAPDEILTGR